MGLSSLRRHRGGYVDRQLVHREPTRDELEEQLRAERAKTSALEAELAAAKAAPVVEVKLDANDFEKALEDAARELPSTPPAEPQPKAARGRR